MFHHGSASAADAATEAFLTAYTAAVGQTYLANLRFHWARYVFHSLNHKLLNHRPKDGNVGDLGMDSVVTFYRSEFEDAVQGRFGI